MTNRPFALFALLRPAGLALAIFASGCADDGDDLYDRGGAPGNDDPNVPDPCDEADPNVDDCEVGCDEDDPNLCDERGDPNTGGDPNVPDGG